MTRAELVEEISNTFERARAQWLIDFDNAPVGLVVFYLSALRKVEREPFQHNYVHHAVLEFLQAKVDEAFDKIPTEDIDQVYQEMERLGYAG